MKNNQIANYIFLGAYLLFFTDVNYNNLSTLEMVALILGGIATVMVIVSIILNIKDGKQNKDI